MGDEVWLNYPDAKEPEGIVVGFVPEGEKRAGQPIIERQRNKPGVGQMQIGEQKKGDRVLIHPMFLLPFPYGGKEWLAAVRGRADRMTLPPTHPRMKD